MITATVLPNILRVSIPREMRREAPILLSDIWRAEFADKIGFMMEMTEPVREFLEKAKFNWHILVYL